MKLITFTLATLLLSSCASLETFQENNKGVGAVHVKSGLISGLINGEATGCITLEGEEKTTCVKEMLFDSETQTCKITLGPCKE